MKSREQLSAFESTAEDVVRQLEGQLAAKESELLEIKESYKEKLRKCESPFFDQTCN